MTAIAELEITLIKRNGERVYYGVVGYRVITNNGVGFLVDAWQNPTELETMISPRVRHGHDRRGGCRSRAGDGEHHGAEP